MPTIFEGALVTKILGSRVRLKRADELQSSQPSMKADQWDPVARLQGRNGKIVAMCGTIDGPVFTVALDGGGEMINLRARALMLLEGPEEDDSET